MWAEAYYLRTNSQVASWSIQPFGHNRHGLKSGSAAVPLLGELYQFITMSPKPKKVYNCKNIEYLHDFMGKRSWRVQCRRISMLPVTVNYRSLKPHQFSKPVTNCRCFAYEVTWLLTYLYIDASTLAEWLTLRNVQNRNFHLCGKKGFLRLLSSTKFSLMLVW